MEYTALYRRFRPKTFDEILGQEHITKTLKNQVISDRVGHAYLFTGCRGCGKTSSAKVLARAINCLNPKNGEPCNECSVCKSALDGSLTDIVEMDAASNNSVDDIRAIRDEVNFLPTVAKYRVYIIDEVHMLSPGAFNALLKTLEEPPKHVKFILATTEPQKLPATILSRCQRFDFKKIPDADIIINLEKICKESNIEYTEGALNLIAELSEGAMRDALSILERCAQDGENKIDEEKIKDLVGIPKIEYISKIAEEIVNGNGENALITVKNVIDEGKDINNILWEIIKYFRDILLYKSTKEISNVYSKEDAKKIEELSSKIDNERLLNIIYKLSELENDIKWSSQKNIVFQVGILKVCSNETVSLEERVEKLENTLKNGTIQVASIQNNGLNAEISRKEGFFAEKSTQAKVNEKVTSGEQQASQINSEKSVVAESTESKQNVESSATKKSADFWSNVIETLKEQRMPMLYSNLVNSRGIMLDDMTVGIEFPNGLNSFGKSVIERPENMAEIKRLVSLECKKDMKVKLIDKKAEENKKSQSNEFNIGIDVNLIDG